VEAVAGWMRWRGGMVRVRGLLRKIRFCVLEPKFLAVDAHRPLPAEHADLIDGLVAEALRVKAAGDLAWPIMTRLLRGISSAGMGAA
jgi:hypothetical protein